MSIAMPHACRLLGTRLRFNGAYSEVILGRDFAIFSRFLAPRSRILSPCATRKSRQPADGRIKIEHVRASEQAVTELIKSGSI